MVIFWQKDPPPPRFDDLIYVQPLNPMQIYICIICHIGQHCFKPRGCWGWKKRKVRKKWIFGHQPLIIAEIRSYDIIVMSSTHHGGHPHGESRLLCLKEEYIWVTLANFAELKIVLFSQPLNGNSGRLYICVVGRLFAMLATFLLLLWPLKMLK